MAAAVGEEALHLLFAELEGWKNLPRRSAAAEVVINTNLPRS